MKNLGHLLYNNDPDRSPSTNLAPLSSYLARATHTEIKDKQSYGLEDKYIKEFLNLPASGQNKQEDEAHKIIISVECQRRFFIRTHV